MKKIYLFSFLIAWLSFGMNLNAFSQSKVYYVGMDQPWTWQLFSYDLNTHAKTKLTSGPWYYNHPEVSESDTNMIVFCSTRPGFLPTGEFNVFTANVNDIDGTTKQITDFSHAGQHQTGPYPNRHPHWHPNGQQIIFTSKNREFHTVDTIVSECSEPTILLDLYRYYEGMNVIRLDLGGNPVEYKALDPFPDIKHYIGHPSFNHEGNKIIFTASDNDGKDWEVYQVGYDPIGMSLIPNSLRQVTSGPNTTSNPIKLSGGATFSYDDSEIYFNSTRTSGGNSQIYKLPADAQNVSVNDATQLTSHHGNDYIPHQLSNGNIVITSDLGPVPLCQCNPGDTNQSATSDLDVVLLHYSGGSVVSREILGTDNKKETLLVSDEVSWFCGTKPNLSSCTYELRIMPVLGLWLERFSYHLPVDLLSGYGSAYYNNAQELYHEGWNNLEKTLGAEAPQVLNEIYQNTNLLEFTFPGFSSPYFFHWLMQYDSVARLKYIVPTVMHGIGIGDSCIFTGTGDEKGNDIQRKTCELMQNYPNPFSQYTTIPYELTEREFVEINVSDLFGREVASLVREEKPRGKHSVVFNSSTLPGGIYYSCIQTTGHKETKKMVLIK